MQKINSLLEVALYVDDIELSASFYQRVLNFEIIEKDEKLWALSCSGIQVLLLCKKKASRNLHLAAHDADGQHHIAFAIRDKDFQSWKHRLTEHKIAIEEIRQWPRGRKSMYFRDPDGHLLELATPGIWFIY